MSPIKLPQIPALSQKVPTEITRAFSQMRDFFNRLGKEGGAITLNDLVGAGVVNGDLTPANGYNFGPPPKLMNVTVTGGFSSIFISWDDPQYKGLAYVEVWRNTTDSLGSAVRVGTTEVALYVDTPPVMSLTQTYYYWVRVVANDSIGSIGPWNATAGTAGTTASDPVYLMQQLAAELGNTYASPSVPNLVFAVTRFALRMSEGNSTVYPFIVAEVPGSPGYYATFIDTAFIKDATITSAKVQSLATDKLYAGSTLIHSALIESLDAGKITSGTITSSNYVPDVQGWRIPLNGTVEFNDANIFGTLQIKHNAVSLASMQTYTDTNTNTVDSNFPFVMDSEGYFFAIVTVTKYGSWNGDETTTVNASVSGGSSDGVIHTGVLGGGVDVLAVYGSLAAGTHYLYFDGTHSENTELKDGQIGFKFSALMFRGYR